MDYRRITAVEPSTPHCLSCGVRIIVIALHHHIAPHDNFTQRLGIVRNWLPVIVDDLEFTRGDQLHALTSLDDRPRFERERSMFRARFAHRDEWRCFRQPIYVSQLPTELTFDPLDRRCGRRRPCCQHPHPRRHLATLVSGTTS